MMNSKLRDMLNDNIRDITGDDMADDELRGSMKEWGWIDKWPALMDENGMVIVGHRRLKIAEELKITPVIERLKLGDGEAADAERLKLAIASNIGFKQMTPKDRKRIAERLYGTGTWSMQRIAEALSTTKKTISKDLEGVDLLPDVTNQKHAKTASNPKGGGRPIGSKKPKSDKPKVRATPKHDKARDIVRPMVEAGEPVNSRKLEKEHGISHVHFESAINSERAAKAAREEPRVERSELSLTAQQKLDVVIKAEKKRLLADFEQAVEARVKEARDRIEAQVPAAWRERLAEADRVMARRKGVIPFKLFRRLLAALHPDRVSGEEAKRISSDIFDEVNKLRHVLCDDKELPVKPLAGAVPRDRAAWEKAFRDRQMARRKQANGSVARRAR